MKKMYSIILNITLLISLASSTMLYCMEPERQKEEKKLQTDFELLPKELKQEVRRLQLMHNTVEFLGLDEPITLVGHRGSILSVAIEGDKVVTHGSFDITAKIWDTNTGQLLLTLANNAGNVKSIAISGNKVVIGSSDRVVKIWDVNTGSLLHTFRGFFSCITSVAIAGDKVAVGLFDKTVKIYDLATLQQLDISDYRHSFSVVAIAGDKLVTGSSHRIVKIWDVNTGEQLHKLEGHTSEIISLAIDGDKVVTGSLDETAMVWDVNTGQLLRTLQHTCWVQSVAIVGDRVAIGLGDGTAKLWDINTGELCPIFLAHMNDIKSVAIVDDKMVTLSSNGTVKICPLSLNLKGTSDDNPLVWIMENGNIPQLDFINRAYEATIAEQYFRIALPEKFCKVEENELQAQCDGRIYFTFPVIVRDYLRNRLNIKPVVVPKNLLTQLNTKSVKIEPAQLSETNSGCAIQ